MSEAVFPIGLTEGSIEAFEVHHWPLVKAYADRIGLVGLINRLVPSRMEVEPGLIVLGMVIDTLSGRSPLYHLSRFFEGQDTELLLGKSVDPSVFCDDTVARVLDLLHQKGTMHLFSEIAMAAQQAFDVPTKHLHFDTTSISLYGDYPMCTEDWKELSITHGYSKDKRPDLKQFIASMLCAGGNVPIFGRSENGNRSDKTLNNQLLTGLSKHMAKFGITPGGYVYIADSAMVTQSNLSQLGDDFFITRLPANYKEHGRVIAQVVGNNTWADVGIISQTPASTRRPAAYYRVAEGDVTLYGKPYRGVVVHSSAHNSRRQKRLQKHLAESLENATQLLSTLEKKTFYCEPDAQAAIQAALRECPEFHRVQLEVVAKPKYARGRPKKGMERQVSAILYQLKGKVIECEEAVSDKLLVNGCFVLLTNLPQHGDQGYSGKEVLTSYKEQSGIEKNFGFLKDDAIVNALFLKKPQRIEALGLILLISLLIWRLMEHQMRDYLSKNDETVPGWDNKPTRKPTSYMVTIKFKGMLILKIGNRRRFGKPLTPELISFLKALRVNPKVFCKPQNSGAG